MSPSKTELETTQPTLTPTELAKIIELATQRAAPNFLSEHFPELTEKDISDIRQAIGQWDTLVACIETAPEEVIDLSERLSKIMLYATTLGELLLSLLQDPLFQSHLSPTEVRERLSKAPNQQIQEAAKIVRELMERRMPYIDFIGRIPPDPSTILQIREIVTKTPPWADQEQTSPLLLAALDYLAKILKAEQEGKEELAPPPPGDKTQAIQVAYVAYRMKSTLPVPPPPEEPPEA